MAWVRGILPHLALICMGGSIEKEELGVQVTLLIQNTQCQLRPGPSLTPTSGVVPLSEDRTPALWRTLFLESYLCSPLIPRFSRGISYCPPHRITFFQCWGKSEQRIYPCNRGPGPGTSRPHDLPLSSQQPREGSPQQEVLRQGVGRDSQEGNPAPWAETAIAAPHFR